MTMFMLLTVMAYLSCFKECAVRFLASFLNFPSSLLLKSQMLEQICREFDLIEIRQREY